MQDFINVLRIMEQYPEVSAIRAFIDVLPEGIGDRRFTKLSDNITKRRYVIAEVYMISGKKFNIIEVEREDRSLSMLILSSLAINDWKSIYDRLLVNLVNDSGTWTSKSLKSIEESRVTVMKAKHSSKGVKHKAEILLNKLE